MLPTSNVHTILFWNTFAFEQVVTPVLIAYPNDVCSNCPPSWALSYRISTEHLCYMCIGFIYTCTSTFDQEKQLSVLAGAIFLVPSVILSGTAWTLKKSCLISQEFKVGRIWEWKGAPAMCPHRAGKMFRASSCSAWQHCMQNQMHRKQADQAAQSVQQCKAPPPFRDKLLQRVIYCLKVLVCTSYYLKQESTGVACKTWNLEWNVEWMLNIIFISIVVYFFTALDWYS